MSAVAGRRVVVREHDKGGPEKLIYEAFQVHQPRADQIVIRVMAAGVNFIDTYHRSGLYPGVSKLGLEGSGIVIDVGQQAAAKYSVGDEVCWINTSGSYATHLVSSFKNPHITKMPSVLFEQHPNNSLQAFKSAAAIFQAFTAHYLCREVYKVGEADTVLIHSGAGGTGGLLIQICKYVCNAKQVITTVSTLEKKQIALQNGADRVILYKNEDFAEKVMQITQKRGCDVVFDGVGKATATKSLKCCAVRGMLVYFGNASGAVDAVDPLALCRQGSVTMIRPTLKDYMRNTEEREMRMNDVFQWIADKKLKIRIGAEYALKNAREAHQALESRQTIGKIILLPDVTEQSKL